MSATSGCEKMRVVLQRVCAFTLGACLLAFAINMVCSLSVLGARSFTPSLRAPMAAEAKATAQAGPTDFFFPARRRGGRLIADSSDSDAEATPRARFLRELAAERGCRGQRDRERQQYRAASWRDSSPRCAGWSCSSTRARLCKDVRRERARRRPREASTEGEPKKRCTVSSSGGSACQHVAVKVFPTGPRDNGEVYWQCAFCGAAL